MYFSFLTYVQVCERANAIPKRAPLKVNAVAWATSKEGGGNIWKSRRIRVPGGDRGREQFVLSDGGIAGKKVYYEHMNVKFIHERTIGLLVGPKSRLPPLRDQTIGFAPGLIAPGIGMVCTVLDSACIQGRRGRTINTSEAAK